MISRRRFIGVFFQGIGRLDRGLSTGRRAELDARIVDVKINRPFGQPENLRDLSRRLDPARGEGAARDSVRMRQRWVCMQSFEGNWDTMVGLG
jgi:hypothetical protein